MAEYYYLSSDGDKIDLHGKIWSDEHWAYGYNHETDTAERIFSRIELEPYERQITLYIRGDTCYEAADIRDRLYKVVQSDVRKRTCGKLFVGDYYLNCYMTGLTDPRGSIGLRTIITEATVVAADPWWYSLETHVFSQTAMHSEVQSEGLDMPFDVPFDLMEYIPDSGAFENMFDSPSQFNLWIYGPCVNPRIVINGHIYGLNATLTEQETVVISSASKRIVMHASDGMEVNAFNLRYKQESVFEPIQTGECNISWPAGCRFQLLLVDQRAEPMWHIPKTEPVIDYSTYLYDSAGEFILDSEGEMISV